MAKLDPFTAQIPAKFLNDPELRPFFEYLNRFLHDLFIRTGGGDDAIEGIGESLVTEIQTSTLLATSRRLEKKVSDLSENTESNSVLRAKITRLNKRIEDLEGSNDNEILNSKIAKLNAKVNKLINELLVAVKALAPDLEQESEKVTLLANILDEIKLLNAMSEEAYETDLDGEDI